jgi:hypothetical protein
MAERRPRRLLLVACVTLGIAVACSADVESRARLLDEECQKFTCATEGNAKEVTGITADSIGFRLGPGVGKVTIPLSTFTRAGDDSFSVELLIAGAGPYQVRLMRRTCAEGGGSCNTAEEVSGLSGGATEEPGWRSAGSFSGSSDTFSNFFVEVETETTTERVDVIDVRYDTFDTIECSVSAVGR